MILIQPKQPETGVYDALAKKYGLGYEWMELSSPSILDAGDVVEKMKAAYDITMAESIHGVFMDINFSGSDEKIYEISVFRMKQCIEAAVSCGVHKVVFHSCFHPVLAPKDPLYKIWAEKSAGLLCGLADKYNVDIYIENVLDRTPAILRQMMQEANHERVHVCLDVGHANLSPVPLGQWMDELAPYIRYLHLSDNRGLYDDHLALGDGTVDFQKMQEKILEYDTQADYTLEVGSPENVERSAVYLQRELVEVWKRGSR